MKKKVLIIIGRYLPGYKDGGPVRSIKNLTDNFGDEFDFKILTSDRDNGDKEPYKNIKIHDWNQVGLASVYYVPEGDFSSNTILKIAKDVDLIYLCGCFTNYAINTLILKRIGKIKIPVVVAAMGLFSPLEFKRKYIKKKVFVELFNLLGLFKGVYWSATSDIEIDNILKQVKTERKQFFIAEDLPRKVDSSCINKEKLANDLRIFWIARIAPIKNLLGTVEILKDVSSNVSFTIFGPKQDSGYWDDCEKELSKLPQNVHWEYLGNLDSENVVDELKKYHVLLFPTFGENYGHVIHEALSAGCACIISDQTPWNNLETNNSGFVFSLDDKAGFVNAIETYANMSTSDFQVVVNSTHEYALSKAKEAVENSGYKAIFRELIKQ